VNNEYDVFTFALSNFGALSGGSATVHLTFAGPDGDVFNNPTTNNAGAIVFSTLSMTTQAPSAVPEPGRWALLASAIGALAARRLFVHRG
jgi:hypothetical protein